MDLLKETLKISDTATELLCDIESIYYIASNLICELENENNEHLEKLVIKKSIIAVNIMFEYISKLEKNIKKTSTKTEAVFQYIREQAKNEKEKNTN